MTASPEATTAQPAPRDWTPVVKILIRLSAVVLAGAASVLILSGISASVYDSANSGKIYPGVSVYGMDLSGLTAAEAAYRMNDGFYYPRDGRITFSYEGRSWTATPAELGLGLDLLATVNDAYEVGRSDEPLTNLEIQMRARFSGVAVAPVLQFDFGTAMAYLQRIAAEVERPAVEAKLEMRGLEVAAIPGQIGRQLNTSAMLALVAVPIGHLANAEIPLQMIEIAPDVLDAAPQAEIARALLSQDFHLTIAELMPGDPGSWSITPAMLADMLTFRRLTDSAGTRYVLALDEGKITNLLAPLTATLARGVENARYQFNDAAGTLELYSPSRRGRALNIAKSIESIQAAVAQGAHGAALGFDFVEPDIGDSMTAAELEITGLLRNGNQWTSFRGSADARIHNITLASEKLNGVLVRPGETFSMGEHVGDVSLDTGYAEALIIMGNRTIKGAGGGVCQVSTTFFRTVFMTGFPINERYAHAYRVGYYENGDGPIHLGAGFDATVSFPTVDFKFTNDSPYWILMETEVDRGAGRLYWRFYSTSDGRTVQYYTTGVTNETDPPDPKWEVNSELTEDWKQVDWAVKGADVIVTRTVSRNGQVILQDRFATHYLAWGAVCQYHPDRYTPPSDNAPCPPE
ncbi:MAG: VanW family protein [Anaerolineales bacterium]|nr:VanW family protein [Anaerolineales bacterium]